MKKQTKRKTPTTDSRFISIWLKNSVVKELKGQAATENRSVNAMITHIIKSYLKYVEGQHQTNQAVNDFLENQTVERDEGQQPVQTLQLDRHPPEAGSTSPVLPPNPFAPWPDDVA